MAFIHFEFLSIEWNLIRLSGTAHGIRTKTVHKTQPRQHSAVIFNQTSYKITEVAVYYLLCMPPLACQVSMLLILSQSEISNNRGFWPFDRQVAITLNVLFRSRRIQYTGLNKNHFQKKFKENSRRKFADGKNTTEGLFWTSSSRRNDTA